MAFQLGSGRFPKLLTDFLVNPIFVNLGYSVIDSVPLLGDTLAFIVLSILLSVFQLVVGFFHLDLIIQRENEFFKNSIELRRDGALIDIAGITLAIGRLPAAVIDIAPAPLLLATHGRSTLAA
ncbi:hypothetical protein [Vampirovibrio sp.]|uniref:hypothetical protein n=1 Tax=Vampirovibrio sp. TaxID=2717857 RepID=UPI0035931928